MLRKTSKIARTSINLISGSSRKFCMRKKPLKPLLQVELKKYEEKKMKKSQDLEELFRMKNSKRPGQLKKKMRRLAG